MQRSNIYQNYSPGPNKFQNPIDLSHQQAQRKKVQKTDKE